MNSFNFYTIVTLSLIACSSSLWDGTSKHRGAIILTLAGKGYPEYLGWSCVSVGASKSLFDLLIFHEDNQYVQNLDCASNVIKINLHSHGLASNTAAAISGENTGKKYSAVRSRLEIVFAEMPYLLAQFKIASGDIFKEFLTNYTHWTYTDPDILWGDISQWIHPDELDMYDIITFGKSNDANRLFLRGQFSLHKNQPILNSEWKGVKHMEYEAVMKQLKGMVSEMDYVGLAELKKKKENEKKAKIYSVGIRRKYFVSAEGPYSTHIFNSQRNYKILVTGRIMSDKLTKPVVWKNGLLLRCNCQTVHQCIMKPNRSHYTTSASSSLKESSPMSSQESLSVSTKQCVQTAKIRSQSTLPSMQLKPLMTQTQGDCGMAWLPVADRLCGIPPSGDISLNEAVLKEGKWYYNDELAAPRNKRHSGSLFHFRVWEDLLASNFVTQTARSSTSCFVIYLSMPTSTMFIHPCDVRVVQNIPILSYRDFRIMQMEQERNKLMLAEAAR